MPDISGGIHTGPKSKQYWWRSQIIEYWEPEVKAVAPGKTAADAPADAIVLFDGSDASAWEAKGGGPIKWKVENGAMTVTGGAGEIHTKPGLWRLPVAH